MTARRETSSPGVAMPLDHPEFPTRVRAKDPEALQAVVHAYLGQILRAARGAGLDPQQAEDVTQATFATFLETAPRFEGRSHVRTWVFGILYRKIAEARRAHLRDQQVDDIDAVVDRRFDANGNWTHPPRRPDSDVYGAQVRERIEECLESAPLQQRMAFVLREVEDLSTVEICKILDVTRTNLGVLLYRARNRLRECLESKGIKG